MTTNPEDIATEDLAIAIAKSSVAISSGFVVIIKVIFTRQKVKLFISSIGILNLKVCYAFMQ